MRTKRFLLVTAALTTATAASACGKDPAMKPEDPADATSRVNNMPANPKGSFYDGGLETPPPPPPPPPSETASAAPPPKKDAGGPVIPRLPANPKGSHYDAGKKPNLDF